MRSSFPCGVPWGRLLFSAKQSVYEAWFPYGGRVLESSGAEVEFTADGRFRRRAAPRAGRSRRRGRGGR
ncbi:hypothetical protein Kpho01_22780 [Kitasatospora phosalacinea]|uniref:Uncharacterized protein n=1 Tax=Kitasatospora phosalacinea TaxID=2065 RepID=A0A9W6UNL0_9ACTN|nr:hypothetical protein Kpho01_22780 [Kitasatospora phosalacinea]